MCIDVFNALSKYRFLKQAKMMKRRHEDEEKDDDHNNDEIHTMARIMRRKMKVNIEMMMCRTTMPMIITGNERR